VLWAASFPRQGRRGQAGTAGWSGIRRWAREPIRRRITRNWGSSASTRTAGRRD